MVAFLLFSSDLSCKILVEGDNYCPRMTPNDKPNFNRRNLRVFSNLDSHLLYSAQYLMSCCFSLLVLNLGLIVSETSFRSGPHLHKVKSALNHNKKKRHFHQNRLLSENPAVNQLYPEFKRKIS